MAEPTLDEIMAYYQERGLLAHEEVVRDVAPKIEGIGFHLPVDELKRNIALLSVWPLVDMVRLTQQGITRDLKKTEKARFAELMNKYTALHQAGEQGNVLEYGEREEQPRMKFVNPNLYPPSIFRKVIERMAEQCESWTGHLRRTTRSHMKTLHDAQMGGALYVIEKGESGPLLGVPFTLYQRSFVCVNARGEPVLFMDAIQHKEGPDVARLNNWRGYDKEGNQVRESSIHQLYAGVAAAVYLAEKLDIRYVVLRDTPLAELARELAIPEKKVFSPETLPWKVGLHSLQRNTGVHVNLLYGSGKDRRQGTQVRYQTLELFPYSTTTAMIQKLEALVGEIVESNRERKSRAPKTAERLQAATALYNLIDEFPLTPSARKQQAYKLLTNGYRAANESWMPITPPSG